MKVPACRSRPPSPIHKYVRSNKKENTPRKDLSINRIQLQHLQIYSSRFSPAKVASCYSSSVSISSSVSCPQLKRHLATARAWVSRRVHLVPAQAYIYVSGLRNNLSMLSIGAEVGRGPFLGIHGMTSVTSQNKKGNSEMNKEQADTPVTLGKGKRKRERKWNEMKAKKGEKTKQREYHG